MSAYIVSTNTIDKIITFIVQDNHLTGCLPLEFRAELPAKFKTVLGRAMFALNEKSVNERYSATDAAPVYSFSYAAHTNAMQALKSIQCWLYQSCEGKCDESELYQAFERIQHRIAMEIIRSMPEYEKALWG